MKTHAQWQQAIETVQDLRSLVRNMKALAAASIRQYELATESLDAYAHMLDLAFMALLRSGRVGVVDTDGRNSIGDFSRPANESAKTLGVIIFGSDHGLCGRFNESIANHALDKINSLQVAREDTRVLAIGARLLGFLERRNVPVQQWLRQAGSAAGIDNVVGQLLIEIADWQRDGIDQIWLFYGAPSTSAPYEARAQRLLPIDQQHFTHLSAARWPARGLPDHAMPSEALFAALIRQYLYVSLYRANAASLASEQASRLRSMRGADRNIEERLNAMATDYQRARQDAITAEILEVISGYEATATARNR